MNKNFLKPSIILLGAILVFLSASSQALIPKMSTHPIADMGVLNEKQIIYWMIKRGELPVNPSEKQKQKAIEEYLGSSNRFTMNHLAPIEVQAENSRLNRHNNKNSISENYTFSSKKDQTKTVKVLAVLVDFPDLKYNENRLDSDDTGMYYDNYSVEHYNGLLFGEDGFEGPQGQNLLSASQYFQAASGDTFSFTGGVKGWVTADKNAEYYGRHDGGSKDNAVPELVKEAITAVAASMSVDELNSYDVEDPYDLNSNGNVNESDGIIDHVMIFHSSIGEEAGGGVLGLDAIWSHRYYVQDTRTGYAIPGTNKKVFGYTAQPIDAAAGVCVHEFGHDLGLPDEYDTSYGGKGSPVGSWSVMSAGSWAGSIPGSEPTGFSAYANTYLQNKYQGNWINEQVVSLDSITNNSVEFSLVEAVDHNSINQITIPLPSTQPFTTPFAGLKQFYSGDGHNINRSMSFSVDLPEDAQTKLTMKAHWDIEFDYDYAQVIVNGVALEGNHTRASNQRTVPNNIATNIITGNTSFTNATDENGWVDLEFDLSAFSGQTITIFMQYTTDQAVNKYGIVVDDLKIVYGGDVLFSDGAEGSSQVSLNGFSIISDSRPGKPMNYMLQLRSFNSLDSGLERRGYVPGVLVWLHNSNYSNNRVSEHEGAGQIAVVDADQTLIGTSSSSVQVRDATFSLYDQPAYSSYYQSTYHEDTALDNVSTFDDSLDYSAPSQPESGLILQKLGISLEVIEQSEDSSSAKIVLRRSTEDVPLKIPLDVRLTDFKDFNIVTFTPTVTGGAGDYQYLWDFGDNSAQSTEFTPKHTFESAGIFEVTLTVTDSDNTSISKTLPIDVELAHLDVDFLVSREGLAASFRSVLTHSRDLKSIIWNFGDDSAGEGLSPNHVYQQAGEYIVSLTVTDSADLQRSIEKSVEVFLPPTADFTLSKTALNVAFSDITSGGEGALSYKWDFGDGTESTEVSPSHTYQAAGIYDVILTVTDTVNKQSVNQQTIEVFALPVASFTHSASNLNVAYTNSSSGGEGSLVYKWNFGDGTESTEASPSHTYQTAGIYDVILTVIDTANKQSVSQQMIEVFTLPVASFTHSASNLNVTYTNTSSGGEGTLSYKWDFGDGNNSTDLSPSHTFAQAGTFTTILTVTDEADNAINVSQQITVVAAPVAVSTTTVKADESSGGGSLSWLLLTLIPLLSRRRKNQVK